MVPITHCPLLHHHLPAAVYSEMKSQYAPAPTAGDSDDEVTRIEAGKGSGRKKKDTGPRDVFGDLDSIVVSTTCLY